MAYTLSGVVTNCLDGSPNCDTQLTQTGQCADNQALGAPDMKYFDLNPNDTITIRFTCTVITEVGISQNASPGQGSPDFKIYGYLDGTGLPTVDVSYDGTTFYTLNMWGAFGDATNPSFELEYAEVDPSQNLTEVRYVRVTQTQAAVVHIDAVEALRPVQ